jgi:hypothetical protein
MNPAAQTVNYYGQFGRGTGLVFTNFCQLHTLILDFFCGSWDKWIHHAELEPTNLPILRGRFLLGEEYEPVKLDEYRHDVD